MALILNRRAFLNKSLGVLSEKEKKSFKLKKQSKTKRKDFEMGRKNIKKINCTFQENNLSSAHIGDKRVTNHDVSLLNTMICDFLARKGLLDQAETVAKAAEVAELFDLEQYKRLHTLLAGLKRGHSDAALKWCDANRARLSRLNV